MKTLITIAALSLLVSCRSTRDTTYEVVNLMPLFRTAWEQARGLPEEEQIDVMWRKVVLARPEVYNAAVFAAPEAMSFEAAFREIYRWYSRRITPNFATMERLSREIESQFARYDGEFRRNFPDFDYTGRVYFLNSFGAFDGALRDIEGEPALLIGVETLAIIHGPGASIKPLLALSIHTPRVCRSSDFRNRRRNAPRQRNSSSPPRSSYSSTPRIRRLTARSSSATTPTPIRPPAAATTSAI